MKYKMIVSVVAVCMLLLCGRAGAHHSFAATYIVDQTATIEGTMEEFLYRNPHSFVKVEVTDDKGQAQTWSLEWGGAAQLSQDHVSKDQLQNRRSRDRHGESRSRSFRTPDAYQEHHPPVGWMEVARSRAVIRVQ